jgi:hypothetical protein
MQHTFFGRKSRPLFFLQQNQRRVTAAMRRSEVQHQTTMEIITLWTYSLPVEKLESAKSKDDYN